MPTLVVVPAPEETAVDAPTWVVIVAGGGGSRFGGPKQFVQIGTRTVLEWSVAAAHAVADGIVVVVPDADVGKPLDVDLVVAGGSTRAASVRNGLAVVPDDVGIVLVHDAARPAATPTLFRAVVAAVRDGATGAVPGVPVTDSLRERTGGAVDRETLVAVQTPQGFEAAALRSAHASGLDASDDATLVERDGGTIVVVDGEITNIKLTHPDDVIVLQRVLEQRSRS